MYPTQKQGNSLQKSCVDQGGVLQGALATVFESHNSPNVTVFGSDQRPCQSWLQGSPRPTSCALSTTPE